MAKIKTAFQINNNRLFKVFNRLSLCKKMIAIRIENEKMTTTAK